MLTERAATVLKATVERYVATGIPVASKCLSLPGRRRWSSATLRSDMADLESMGLLAQRHISAGRFPTEEGIRYYVDHLVDPLVPEGAEREMLRGLHAAASWDESLLVRRTSLLLSALAGEASCAYVCREREVFVEGRLCLLGKPEYSAADKLRSILAWTEDRAGLASLLERPVREAGVRVYVGRENARAPVKDLSMVLASYRKTDRVEGTLGVIGSLRMEYNKDIALVGLAAELLGEALRGRRSIHG